MNFVTNYKKLWEELKTDASMLVFKEGSQNEKEISKIISDYILKKMQQLEDNQKEEYKKINEFFKAHNY